MKDHILHYQVNIAHFSWEFPNGRSHLNEYAINKPREFKIFQNLIPSLAEAFFYHMPFITSSEDLPLDSTEFLKNYLKEVSKFLDDSIHKVIHQDDIGEYHFDVNMHLDYRHDTKDYEARFSIQVYNWNRDISIKYINWDPKFDKRIFLEVMQESVRTLDDLTLDSVRTSVKTLLFAFCNVESFVNNISIRPSITKKNVVIELESDEITVEDVMKG